MVVPSSPVRTAGKVHFKGAVLLAAWLVCLLFAITNGAHWGWTDSRVLGLVAAAAIFFYLWVTAETRVKEPLIDLQMMRAPRRLDRQRRRVAHHQRA